MVKGIVRLAGLVLTLISMSACISAVTGGEPQASHPPDAPSQACDPERVFRASLHEAIYAALKYPAQTAYQAATGLTTLEYDYKNGRAANIRITDPSGDSVLDRVAATAVRDAKYPLPESEFVDKTIHDTVFVIFDNTGELRRASGYHLVDSSEDQRSAKTQDTGCAAK